MECELCGKEIKDNIQQHGILVCIDCASVLQSVDVCPYCYKIVNIHNSVDVKDSGVFYFLHHNCYHRREEFRKY